MWGEETMLNSHGVRIRVHKLHLETYSLWYYLEEESFTTIECEEALSVSDKPCHMSLPWKERNASTPSHFSNSCHHIFLSHAHLGQLWHCPSSSLFEQLDGILEQQGSPARQFPSSSTALAALGHISSHQFTGIDRQLPDLQTAGGWQSSESKLSL